MNDTNEKLEQTRITMNGLAAGIDAVLNGPNPEDPANAFVALVFGMGDPTRVNYVSNAKREDIITALRQAADQLEARGHGVQ